MKKTTREKAQVNEIKGLFSYIKGYFGLQVCKKNINIPPNPPFAKGGNSFPCHPSMFLAGIQKKAWMPAFAGMTMMFLSTFTFASNTTNNLYDANGHLIASCSDKSGCSYLVYKGLSQAGSIKAGKYKHYFTGPQGKLAVIDIDKTQSSQTMTWLNTDFHDTVMVSSVGNTPQQNTLDAFGNDLQPESFAKEKIYTDKHPVDSAKSLYNFNARFYDSEIGRFTTVDPIEQANLNWYTYVNNNPLFYTDPTGKSVLTKGFKLILKGGDVAGTVEDVVADIITITSPVTSSTAKLIAVISVGSELLPISVGDIKDIYRYTKTVKKIEETTTDLRKIVSDAKWGRLMSYKKQSKIGGETTAIEHVIYKHGAQSEKKGSKFLPGTSLKTIKQDTNEALMKGEITPIEDGSYKVVHDTGRIIGTGQRSGKETSTLTVFVKDGQIRTVFPTE